MDRLSSLEGASNGLYNWSESTGLKQLIRNRELDSVDALDFIEVDFIES